MSPPHICVVGASLGGVRTVEALRAEGFDGRVSLIGAESDEPYDRPPLSKQYLAGSWDVDRIALRSAHSLRTDLNVDLKFNVTAESLNLDERVISTSTGTLAFDGLVIATGTRARTLPDTEHLPNVHVLRTLADASRLRTALLSEPRPRVVVIGAGFIGAEVASTARAAGCEVTVLEALPVPLERQLGRDMALGCAALHGAHGVALHTDVRIHTISEADVTLEDGRTFPAEVVVVGVGVAPNTEWLTGSGLRIEDGVVCDETCRAAPSVVAVGDVARWPNVLFDAEPTMRVEHWTNAAEMAAHAASTLLADLAGQPTRAKPFAPVPYFWSDQYDVKIQFLGRATGFDEVRVVDGITGEGKWLALYRRDERLVGALGVSKIRQLMPYRKLLSERASWTRALEQAGAT